MALEDLMKQLQDNAYRTKSRRIGAEQMLNSMMTQTGRSSGGGGRNSGRGGGGAASGPIRKGKWPAKGERHQHDGYDWAKWAGDINVPGSGDLGNFVGAYRRGKVVAVNHWDKSYGNHVIVRHPNGTETLYAHLQNTNVKPGQRVKKGQLLGHVGSTGNSSGPHLHFEIR